MDGSFHVHEVSEVIQRLGTDLRQGLSEQAAARRFRETGPNEILRAGTRHPLRILRDQFLSPMVLLLLTVVGISVGIGHFGDAVMIGTILLFNAWVGFFQEFRAEKAMESIRRIAAPIAKALRGGRVVKIPAREVVPGDVILLEAGDGIPADLRFAEACAIQVDESLLTGESIPVFKETNPLHAADLAIGDQSNLGFTGTLVVSGRGLGIVVRTGKNTELGRIASLLNHAGKGKTLLERNLQKLARKLVLTAFFLCLSVLVIGLWRGEAFVAMLLTSLSLGVAAIPEGLPAVITISLSLGSLRLARRGALVRRLQAVEALGSITVICADKTGTLTQNRMQVRYPKREASNHPFILAALVLCNDADLAQGDPMEMALLQFAAQQGMDIASIRAEWRRISEIPFDSNRRRMTTVHELDTRRILLMKGAPEKVLCLCRTDSLQWEEWRRLQEKLTSQGLRVIAVAMKELNSKETMPLEENLELLGFVGLQDPLREEAKSAIAECRTAGIRPVMITGDHPTTATAIAKELGIFQDGDPVITGTDLKGKNQSLRNETALRASVFARVSPEDKLAIVQLFKDRGEFVAMTGDGVNDAPALRAADLGIAMGRGTDVAKEASSLVLVEENFSTIVRAVKEGRIIHDNIRKFVRYLLATNLAEIATMFLAALWGFPAPLLPIQILWINLATDGLPAVALGYEPAEGNVMSRRPRPTGENILGRGLWQHVLWVGILMGCLMMGLTGFLMRKGADASLIRTSIFTALTFAQLGHVLAIRSEFRPLWRIGFFSNWRLAIAVLGTMGVHFLILQTQSLNRIFHVVPLSLKTLVLCFIPGLMVYAAVELEKKWKGAPCKSNS